MTTSGASLHDVLPSRNFRTEVVLVRSSSCPQVPPIIMDDTFLVSCFCFWDLCPSVAIVLSADRNYAYVNRKTFTLSSVPTRLRWASWPSRLLQSISMAQTFPLPRSHNPLSSLTGINPSSTGVSVRRASSDAPSSLMRICPFRQCFFHIFLL